jgi:hypothetical protein
MKVLVLVVSSLVPPWDMIAEEGVRKTWWKDEVHGVESLFYCGGADRSGLIGDTLLLKIPEDFSCMVSKTAHALSYAHANYEFDYLFRVNVSSYVNKRALVRYLADKPSTGLYSGVLGGHSTGPFVSGAGILMSRDVVKVLADSYATMPTGTLGEGGVPQVLEDVSMSLRARALGIQLTPGFRKDVDASSAVPMEGVADAYHFRCKCDGDRMGDVRAMHAIHKVLHSEEVQNVG